MARAFQSLSYILLLFILCLGCFLVGRPTSVCAQPESVNGGSNHEPRVWKLKFKGNDTFKDLVLRSAIALKDASFIQKTFSRYKKMPPLNERDVRIETIRLRQYYQRRGFDDVKVSYTIEAGPKPWLKTVTFTIQEGAPITVQDITYRINADSATRETISNSNSYRKLLDRHQFREGKRYAIIHRPDVEGRFSDVLQNLGYAHTSVDIKAKVDSVFNAAEVSISLNPGPRSYLENIKVEGNETISKKYIIRYSGLRKGDRFELDELESAQRLLVNHHLIRFTTINIPTQDVDSTLNLNLRVRERSLRSITATTGYSLEEKLRGSLSWTHRNVAGLGHEYSVNMRASFLEQRFGMDYIFPYVFNSKSKVILTPFAEHLLESNYELVRYGITNSFVYQHNPNITSSAAYQLTRNYEVSTAANPEALDDTLEYNISAIQLNGIYGQQSLRNQEGWVVQPFVEISGFATSATFNFQKMSLDVRRYAKVTDKLTLAGRVQGSTIFASSQDSLPRNIRIYSGGTNSVRGWSRNMLGPKQAQLDQQGRFSRFNPVGGRALFAFNSEIRRNIESLIPGITLATFLDGGQVWHEVSSIGNRPLQFGVGGGIRYQSPIGPVRLDLAYKLNPTQKDLNKYRGNDYGNQLARWGIHISIGQAF